MPPDVIKRKLSAETHTAEAGTRDIPMPAKKRPLYENCSVFGPGPDGVLMFRASKKKIDWYVSRNLAVPLTQCGTSIRLLFEPKGTGRSKEGDEYYLEDRENQCCVCGSLDRLTSHHIVPHAYRRYMPSAVKDSSSHDVVLLCVACHDDYEHHATIRKQNLATTFDIPLNGRGHVQFPENRKLQSVVKALLVPRPNKIPATRIEELERQARLSLGLAEDADIPREVMDEVMLRPVIGRSEDFEEHGQVVVAAMSDDELEAFVIGWREHFLKHAKPRFLSDKWRADHRVRNTM
ncbi:hypothetical protein HKX48_007390 [Thoreauomyces humboldtii]|nr:hypothetical protein HKX48_007390 [Thoreauomyces humboldtii]